MVNILWVRASFWSRLIIYLLLLAAAVFTVVLLFALLPAAGVFAAAVASTVAYGVSLALLLRALWRPGSTGDGDRRSGTGKALRRATGAPPVTGDACELG